MNGFGVRPYNWEFSAGVQREVASRMSVEFAYFRRWFGNFAATDNRALAATDFSPFSVTAPVDARLPGGGGNLIPGFLDANKIVAQDNYFTAAGNVGSQIQHWNGFDLTTNIRPRQGVLLQGGISTGKTLTDNCEILAKLPEIAQLGVPYCHQETPFLTQVKLFGAYTLPKVDVQISGAFQSIPGPQLAANQVIPNAADQAIARARPDRRRRQRDGQPGAARQHVRRSAEPARPPVCQAAAVRADANVAEPGSVQRLQRQHRAGGELDVFKRVDHRLARPDDHRDGAVREDQRAVRLLGIWLVARGSGLVARGS